MTATTTGMPARPDAAAFRAAMGRFPTGVTLLTLGSGDTTTAMTLNSLTSVSLNPLLLLVSIKTAGRMRPLISRAQGFAVNVLGEDQRHLAQEFARPGRPEGRAAMTRLAAVPGITGHAVLPTAESSFECALEEERRAGDHTLLIGRVVAVGSADNGPRPLVFHQGAFTGIPTSPVRG
ncbi:MULTISPECIES: flavin reductase family protein [unclassified Streptomyces]|jgi:flavin reductase (DIM6/NTAB) family NADH-FMN oxidoreductase RutF|uniref:flavin reductase family protein n=1 Tax=unclassified Streptomyces TaxID=2593676 RepID=UPI003CE76314